MTTRIYYLPKSRISIYLINHMFERIGCSIGELRVNRSTNTIKVPITCNDNDVPRIERILKLYDMMEK